MPRLLLRRTPYPAHNLLCMKHYRCTSCLADKPESEFHLRPKYSENGRPVAYHCKECRSERDRFEETWKRQFKRHKGICQTCQKPVSLVTETQCGPCLTQQGLRRCRRCHEVKPLILEFTLVRGTCDDCTNKHANYWADKDQKRAKRKEELAAMSKKERVLDNRLRSMYNISLPVYRKMVEDQHGLCAICGEKQDGRQLAVDHDHATGKVRRLLCVNCNIGLGYFKDRPELLDAASTYLRHFKG